MVEVDNTNEDLDFLGDGSMKDIAMRMSDIDKVLAEITDMEEKPTQSSSGSNIEGESWERSDNNRKVKDASSGDVKGLSTALSFEDSTASINSDSDIYADDYGSGVAHLQGELKEFDERQRWAEAETAAAAARAETQERDQESFISPDASTEKSASATPPRTLQQGVTATVVKPTPTSVVGISMKSSKGVTQIVRILESGMLADTPLRAGMELVEINGVVVKSAKHARALIESAPDEVSIIAHEILRVEV